MALNCQDSVMQEAAVEYVASTIERLMKQPGERVYVISTYVIGKEKILLEVSPAARLGCRAGTDCCSSLLAAAHRPCTCARQRL